MADSIDMAQERIEAEMQARLAARRHTALVSAEFCECGEPIPARRRELIPGVQTCTDCQEHAESKKRNFR